jgi:Fe-S cluster assembly iron-binding protein IscA
MRINVTESAIQQFSLILLENGIPGSGIRISATQSNCGSPLRMDIEEEEYHGDYIKKVNGIDFFVEKEAVPYLRFVTIDFTGINFKMQGMPERSCS